MSHKNGPKHFKISPKWQRFAKSGVIGHSVPIFYQAFNPSLCFIPPFHLLTLPVLVVHGVTLIIPGGMTFGLFNSCCSQNTACWSFK